MIIVTEATTEYMNLPGEVNMNRQKQNQVPWDGWVVGWSQYPVLYLCTVSCSCFPRKAEIHSRQQWRFRTHQLKFLFALQIIYFLSKKYHDFVHFHVYLTNFVLEYPCSSMYTLSEFLWKKRVLKIFCCFLWTWMSIFQYCLFLQTPISAIADIIDWASFCTL